MDDLAVAASPALITCYDDRSGERAAVTAAELGDWAAATAALLIEGCGLRAGDRVAVLLMPHWQTAAVLLGAWSAGLEVSYQEWATAGLRPAGDFDATFVAGSRLGSWLEEIPRGRHQFVVGDAPDGYKSFNASVRPYLGARPPVVVPGTLDPALQDLMLVAGEMAAAGGIGHGDRVLIDTSVREQPLTWLLAPLSVGASVVLCANLNPATLESRMIEERITKVVR